MGHEYFDFLEVFLDTVELSDLARCRGSPQSCLLSFMCLNLLTAMAISPSGKKLAAQEYLSNPKVFHDCGVPPIIDKVEQWLVENDHRERRLSEYGSGYGDDRFSTSYQKSDHLVTKLAMIYVNRCEVSPKSGVTILSKDKFSLATFCANAMSYKECRTVNDTRSYLKSQGSDANTPNLAEAPTFYQISRRGELNDRGYERLVRNLPGSDDSRMNASTTACVNLHSDTLGEARRVIDYKERMEEECSFSTAISIAVASYPMMSHKPTYMSYEESIQLFNELETVNDLVFEEREESHLVVYDDGPL